VGSITYTQMTNARGGIECDVTVARLAEDRFRIVTGTAFGAHDGAWLRTHGLEVTDVTSQYACFGLWGPNAKRMLAFDFPYMQWREVTVGTIPCIACRVTFVGEHGWELYCPMEFGARLWATLWELGEPHGIVAGGYRAIDSLRLEKGYRVWAADITPDITPAEAGLAKGEADRRLRCLVLEDPDAVVLGNEPVRAGGEVVGRVTSGGYGYTVERSIAYAYLPSEAVEPGRAVEVEIFGEWVAGEVAAEPLFDPAGERIRA
jgi:4-methylaminobutanoate oxidase (formaldehyde-forming)